MQTKFKSVIPRALDLFLACLLIVGGLVATMPTPASGLEVQKCTARSNADNNSSDILGGTETRVTLEVQATSAEQVKGMSLTFPDGTTFSTDETRVTALTGADRMTRNTVNATATANGQTLNLDFANAAPKNSYIRVEIYGVFFPSSGGDMNITGTYTLANGQTSNIDGIPAIKVTAIDPAQQLSDNLAQQDWVQAWNSNRFLHLFFDPTILVSSFPVVLNGFFMALAIVAVSFPLAIPLGLLLALMRMSKIAVLRGIASVYVNVVRGTPLFLQIYIAFFGLPLAGIDIASFPLGVIVLSMNSCAYQCEIIPCRHPVHSEGPVRGIALVGHECGADHDVRHHPADGAAHHSHHDERVHPAVQGHVHAGSRRCHGSGHVREDDRGEYRFHHTVHCGRLLLSGHHAAAGEGGRQLGAQAGRERLRYQHAA